MQTIIKERRYKLIVTPSPVTLLPPIRVTPQLIIECVCQYFHVPIERMREKISPRSISDPKFFAMRLIRQMCKSSQEDIARFFDCDHSTVHYGLSRACRRIQDDGIIALRVKEIRKIVEEKC